MKTKFYFGLVIKAMVFVLPFQSFSQNQAPTVVVDQVLLNNIDGPWGMAFINDNELLFTEKAGKLWRYVISTNTKTQITGLPAVTVMGQGGLLDVALHPDFNENGYVYLAYAVSGNGGQTTALGRGRLSGNTLQNFTELFRALPIVNNGNHFSGRIAFDQNNFVYLSVGDRGNAPNAQNLNIHLGKILRFNDDGTVPSDNPFVGQANARPEIWSWGHRNVQGLAMNPATGKIFAHEHGPRGGDELNLVKKGANYGWPAITFGIDYNGTIISEDTAREGMEQPLTYWVPSIAPSGLAFLNIASDTSEAHVLIGALVQTHIHYVRLNNYKKTASSRSLEGYARFRDVEVAPDGKIYALSEGRNELIRLRLEGVVASVEKESVIEKEEDFVYPNPGSSAAVLNIALVRDENVSVVVKATDGSIVQVVQGKVLGAGKHKMALETEKLPAGIYYAELTKGTRKSVLKYIKL